MQRPYKCMQRTYKCMQRPYNIDINGLSDRYKNNNGNSSLGLVPIHRLQPRLFTMPDYCYSDRLLLRSKPFSAAHGFRVLPVTA